MRDSGPFHFTTMSTTATDLANLALTKIGCPIIEDIHDNTTKEARTARIVYDQARQALLRAHFWPFASKVSRVFQVEAQAIDIDGPLRYTWPSGFLRHINPPTLWYKQDVADRPQYQEHPAEDTAETNTLFYTGTHWRLVAKVNDTVDATWDAANGSEQSPELADWSESATGLASGVPAFTLRVDPELIGWSNAFVIPDGFLKLLMLRTKTGQKIDHFDMRRVNGVPSIVTHDINPIFIQHVWDVQNPDDFDPLFTEALTSLMASKMARALTQNANLEAQWMQVYQKVDLPAARLAAAHDLNSNENHPLREFLAGDITRMSSGPMDNGQA